MGCTRMPNQPASCLPCKLAGRPENWTAYRQLRRPHDQLTSPVVCCLCRRGAGGKPCVPHHVHVLSHHASRSGAPGAVRKGLPSWECCLAESMEHDPCAIVGQLVAHRVSAHTCSPNPPSLVQQVPAAAGGGHDRHGGQGDRQRDAARRCECLAVVLLLRCLLLPFSGHLEWTASCLWRTLRMAREQPRLPRSGGWHGSHAKPNHVFQQPPHFEQMVKDNEKARALEQEMHAIGEDQRVIVFANTKRQVGSGSAQSTACGAVWLGPAGRCTPAVAIMQGWVRAAESTHLTGAVRRRDAHHGLGLPYRPPRHHAYAFSSRFPLLSAAV